MRIFFFFISCITTIALVVILNTKLVLPAPLGKFLAPQHGLWQNADPVNEDFSGDISMEGIKGKVEIYFDDKLIPHVFAEKESDAWFTQGYLHAKFRLWQMEFQTLAAAGRASEIVGDVALNHDREFRRLGMVYAAENSLKEIEKNEITCNQTNAYTDGVNAYIATLTESNLPLEYKLLDYYPEKWTNLKSALFLKYMTFELSGHEDDFEMTNARDYFSSEDFNLLYPARPDSASYVIPNTDFMPVDSSNGMKIFPQLISLQPPSNADSIYFNRALPQVEEVVKPDEGNGSNSWAIGAALSASKAPILCSDPHLALNLPSVWFEMQITTSEFNTYGVSLPGAPGIVIGFNDSCAFGLTNAERDVRDYYEIQFKDASRKEYKFNGQWLKTTFRIEEIKIVDKPSLFDTVAYTIFGPVMYDKNFGGKKTGNLKNYAVRWKGHDASNELLFTNLLDRAHNYSDYTAAIKNLHSPGQNVTFAAKNGDIALYAQGQFPAKWKGQGDFIMPGDDSSYMWRGLIPQNETPFQYNPASGFVSSANQWPTDSSYPYYMGRNFMITRGWIINQRLKNMRDVTPGDMMALQTDDYNVFAEWAMPLLLKNINERRIESADKKYLSILKQWNYKYDVDSKGATIFEVLWKTLMDVVYKDEFEKAPHPIMMPSNITLLEAIKRDSAYKFIDNIGTVTVETLEDDIVTAFRNACVELRNDEAQDKLSWAHYKDTRVAHLLKIPALGHLHVNIAGSQNCINSTKENHGPGWRMIINLKPETEAYGVYAGGQSGNPGSKYYDNFINKWTEGKYYKLWVMKKGDENNDKIKWTVRLLPRST